MNGGVDHSVPWWVQAIGVVGVTAAIALYLVYWVTNTVSTQLTTINTQVTNNLVQSAAILKAVQDAENDPAVIAFRKLQLRFALQECINNSKSPTQTRDCIDIGKEGGVQFQ
jgi:hypothetical protein